MNLRDLLLSELLLGTLIPIEEFETRVEQRYFTDNDGHGYYLVADSYGIVAVSVEPFKPSQFKRHVHGWWPGAVLWFNK